MITVAVASYGASGVSCVSGDSSEAGTGREVDEAFGSASARGS